MAALDGETRRVLNEAGCGMCCGTADAEGLARIACKFAALSDSDKARMGDAARDYYLTHFTKDRLLDELEGLLTDLCKER